MRASGLISQDANKKRAVTLNKPRAKSNYIPLIGNVSAGTGILAVENIEGEFPIPQEMFAGDDLFMLRVEGSSMINAGIANGYTVIVHSKCSAEMGEIVVVFCQYKATIKRLHSTTPSLVLHPENDEMDDIVIPYQDDPVILGKVIGCIKKF